MVFTLIELMQTGITLELEYIDEMVLISKHSMTHEGEQIFLVEDSYFGDDQLLTLNAIKRVYKTGLLYKGYSAQ